MLHIFWYLALPALIRNFPDGTIIDSFLQKVYFVLNGLESVPVFLASLGAPADPLDQRPSRCHREAYDIFSIWFPRLFCIFFTAVLVLHTNDFHKFICRITDVILIPVSVQLKSPPGQPVKEKKTDEEKRQHTACTTKDGPRPKRVGVLLPDLNSTDT